MFNLFKKQEEKEYEGTISNWVVDAALNRLMEKYGITQDHIDKVKTALDLAKLKDNGDSVEITITIKK